MTDPLSPRSQTTVRSTVIGEEIAGAAVVIIDDHHPNVALLERLLNGAGIVGVDGFTDPREALAHCAASLPDLILLDLHMPGLDGFAVMDALDELVPDGMFLPVLVLTADVASESKERALAGRAKDFLTKPFDRTEVLLRVTNLLETRALHRRLEQHNTELRASLDARTAADQAVADEHHRRHERVDAALDAGALTMAFQPVADLTTGTIVGAEALARFTCEPRRPPNEWFAEANLIGRGGELELAAVSAALDHLHALPTNAFLAVNTSPATAASPELAALLADRPAERLVFELTEHDRVDDYNALIAGLAHHRGRGVRIAVDDTGAGYAGLAHVLRLRPDIVKLDIALTRGIHTDPVRRALATALTAFAAEIDAIIIAEGIEIPEELAALHHIGIPWGQGYHLARPTNLPFPDQRLPAHRAARDR